MEQINNIELIDSSIYPTNEILENVLGKSFSVYQKVLELYEELGLIPEWKYYKDGKAWLCKVVKKKRTIVWMSAWKNYMKASIYFPEQYLNNILALGISENSKNTIINTKNVGKSKPCMFELKEESVIKDFKTVMQYKIDLK